MKTFTPGLYGCPTASQILNPDRRDDGRVRMISRGPDPEAQDFWQLNKPPVFGPGANAESPLPQPKPAESPRKSVEDIMHEPIT